MKTRIAMPQKPAGIQVPQRRPQIQVATPQQQRAIIVGGSSSVDTLATINGCCGLFDLCGDADLMSLSFQGVDPFLDWIGWEPTDVCKIIKNFITWVRPARSTGTATPGYVGDPCGASYGVEWGTCDFTLDDFGRLRRKTPTRDITRNGLRLCENQPRYRLDGSPITDDMEFDMRLAVEVLMQDLKSYVITGNHATAGLFDGLELLVKDGYTASSGRPCGMMDSIVIDWNGNNLDGGAGMTWNGAAIANPTSIIAVLLAAYRRIRQRIRWSPTLAAQNMRVGDMVIVGTTEFLGCLKDAYTCWSVCPGVQYNEANLNTFEARTFRDRLEGGQFGFGRIYLDGFEIPLIAYDWELIKATGHSDFYLLTGSVGSVKLISGQYNDMRKVPQAPGGDLFDVTDGGRLLTWVNSDETCVERLVEMQPRILMWAPWAQMRVQDIVCNQPGGAISPDPDATSWFPETSFSVVDCPA